MMLQTHKKDVSILQGHALDHAVDESLHRLLPSDERLLRRRFHLGVKKAVTRVRHLHAKGRELAALRTLRRMTLSPARGR
jgi:hypothetical protein